MTEITIDYLFNEKLKFYQYKKGYRFSVDPILLANFIFSNEKLSYLEIGSGIGIIPIILKYYDLNNNIEKIYSFEIQKELFKLANENLKLNLSINTQSIEFINQDINNVNKVIIPESIDVVFSNPPYYEQNSGRLNPNSQKSIARHEIKLNLKELIKNTNYILKPKGSLKLIYPSIRFSELIRELEKKKLYVSKLIFIRAYKEKNANLFLIEAKKGIKQEIQILPDIIIYDKNNIYSDYLNKILELKPKK